MNEGDVLMKIMDKKQMKIMDEKRLLNPFRVTLAGLFKKSLCAKMVKAFEESSEEKIEKRKDENNQHILLRTFFSAEYRRTTDGTDISNVDATRMSRFFTYYIDTTKYTVDADTQYYTIKDNIICITKKAGFSFSDFDLLSDIKSKIEIMFSALTDTELADYKNDINRLLSEFEKNDVLKDYKDDMEKLEFYDLLSRLIVIASTWSCWANSVPDAKALALVLLPQKTKLSDTDPSENDWKEKQISSERSNANKLLNFCKSALENNDYTSCIKYAQEIITINFAEDLTIGEAYYYLSIYSTEGLKEQFDKKLMSISARLGFTKAYEHLRSIDNTQGAPLLWQPLSETHGIARIVLNSANEYTEEFLISLPAEMQNNDILKKMVFSASGKKQLQATVDPSIETRYLLFDENYEKNFRDLLYILDKISIMEKKSSIDSILSSEHWSKTTIHIRVSEDKYSTLIDTALKRLGNFIVRVYIIDDEKHAAQALLTDYPLYDMLKGLSQETLVKGPVTLNFTVISDTDSSMAMRLIREAYWISSFSYPGLKVKLNLISPDAKMVKQALRFSFPSMFVDIPDADQTSAIHVLDEPFEISSISDYHLIQHIDAIETTKNAFNYYVIHVGDDVSNLNLAIKIRELSIRNKIDSGKRPYSKGLPTITFYCKDSDIAYLAQNMVVQAVDHGDRWHNNYNVIPFGMLHDTYSWNAIDGGFWEKVAQSTHLQYCGIKTDEPSSKKIASLIEYFSRNYNRDSSMAVALSLPYRLFQVKNPSGDHIIPSSPIDNLDLAKENPDIIAEMAEQFNFAMNDTENKKIIIKKLLYSEHVRWIRWAYSRGWKEADPEQVILYMNAGNPKQQLYIARLHGCLCSIDDLKHLSERMIEELLPNEDGSTPHRQDWDRFAAKREKDDRFNIKTGSNRVYSYEYKYSPKNFTEIDISNILATADIIQTLWLEEKSPDNIVEH